MYGLRALETHSRNPFDSALAGYKVLARVPEANHAFERHGTLLERETGLILVRSW